MKEVSINSLRVIISGGGTGGHIYPALAIAKALQQLDSNIEILFVGAEDRMEMQKIPEAGYTIIGLPITGIQRRLTWKNLLFPFKLWSSIKKAKNILKDFEPHVVVGVGGFASGPLLYAATQRSIPALIQEQNGYAGLANKWLAGKVQIICVAYEHMERYFPNEKIILAGNPVREDIKNVSNNRNEALNFYQLDENRPVILVIGGSLGARTINQSLLQKLGLFAEKGIQLIWQTGKFYFQDIKSQLTGTDQSDIRLCEFIEEMSLAYAAADVVISRAGALSIAELCLVQKPAILVPSPNVAEDHQTKNAMALVSADAALLVRDEQAVDQLVSKAISLVQDTEKKLELTRNIGKMARPNAAEDIASEVLKLAS
jgi:UDP-N-acetylglucosamine--N-acetylmuramyl-(pentapeptide) pyrophosphoryl-undecaprenol N-acetylglucosamine transferase